MTAMDDNEKRDVWEAIRDLRRDRVEDKGTLAGMARDVTWIVSTLKDDRDGMKATIKGVCDNLEGVRTDVGHLKIKAGMVSAVIAFGVVGLKVAVEFLVGGHGK